MMIKDDPIELIPAYQYTKKKKGDEEDAGVAASPTVNRKAKETQEQEQTSEPPLPEQEPMTEEKFREKEKAPKASVSSEVNEDL